MVVLVSTEKGRVIAAIGGGLIITVVLWVIHLNAAGLVGLLATVGALITGAMTVAFAAAVIVEGSIDKQARASLWQRLRPGSDDSSHSGRRCRQCRRPLVRIGDVALCATCDL